MLPEIIGGAGGDPSCSSTMARSTPTITTDNTLHSRPLRLVISREPSQQSSSTRECAGIENLNHFSGTEDARKVNSDCVFGPVPSQTEVRKAVAELQRLMHGESESNSYPLQLLVSPVESRMSQCPGYGRLHDAMSMFEREPPIQNMVLSLSCDKAIWEAILSNRAVQDLRGTISAAKEEKGQSSYKVTDLLKMILNWIIEYARVKVVELIDKFGLMATEILQKENPILELTAVVKENIVSAVLLAVVILLVVVVTRSQSEDREPPHSLVQQ